MEAGQKTPRPGRARSLRPGAVNAPRVPPTGSLIGGAYRVKRTLGRGGMGVVLLCEDVRLDRDVAVKIVSPDYLKESDSRAKFALEARAMAGVRHENVANLYAFGEHEGQPYFVMEYVPGTTVAEWVYRHTQASLVTDADEVVGILEQVCRGLTAIHRAGIIHGDIKPGNVLLGPSFRAVVTDFGLMRWLGQAENLAVVIGTPAYIPPEVVHADDSGLRLTPAADVYALGVTAYEMFTGRLPYAIASVEDLFRVHQAHLEPPSLTEARPDLSGELGEVVGRALAGDLRVRYASADELRRALVGVRMRLGSTEKAHRIVVADDDEDFLALVAETVRAAFPRASVVEARDGGTALRAIEAQKTSLAIVDLRMPGLNGFELVAALRGSEQAADVPIVVVTAHGGATDWSLLSSMGAAGFLVKPLDPYALVALARSLVDASEPRRVARST